MNKKYCSPLQSIKINDIAYNNNNDNLISILIINYYNII